MPKLNFADIEAKVDAMFDTGTGDNDAQATTEDSTSSTSTENQGQDNTVGAQGEGNQSSSGTADAKPGNVSADSAATGQGAKGKQAPAQQQQQPDNAPRPGDIVGPDGRVLARAGAERRHYEAAQRATRELTNMRGELQQAQTQLAALREAHSAPQQLGLSPQEATTAAQFMAHWKRDPVGAAKNMLAELKAAGYSLDELATGVDVSAIQRMMDERLAPFQQDRQRETERAQREQQLRQEVEREIAETFATFPWAQRNETAIDALMAQQPHLTLQQAALQIERWALRNGYDLGDEAAPLVEQVNARRSSATQQTHQQVSNNARGPSGAPAAPNATPRRNVPVEAGRSNRDIVRETMRDFGIEVP